MDIMEGKPLKLCVLCCYSYRAEVEETGCGGAKSDKRHSKSKGSPVLSRFCQEILTEGGCSSKPEVSKVRKRKYGGQSGRRGRKKKFSGGGKMSEPSEVREEESSSSPSFETMTVCPGCLSLLGKVSEARSRASVVELGVAKLQRRILVELRKLKEEMGHVYLELKRVEEVMSNGDTSSLQSLASEKEDGSEPGQSQGGIRQTDMNDVITFREKILYVSRSLASYQEELVSKLLLPQEGEGVPTVRTVVAVKFERASRSRRQLRASASDSAKVCPFPGQIKIEDDLDIPRNQDMDDPFLPVSMPPSGLGRAPTLDDTIDSDPISPASFHEFQGLYADCNDDEDQAGLPGGGGEFIPQLQNDSSEADDDDEEWVARSRKRKAKPSPVKKSVTKERAPRPQRKSITPRPSKLPGVDFTGMSSWRKEIVTRVHRRIRLQKIKASKKIKSSNSESGEVEDDDDDPFQKFPLKYDPSTGFLTIGDIKDLIINDTQESLECSRCPYRVSEPMKFSNPAEWVLFSHVLGHHLDAFNCKYCGQKFTGLKRFTLHLKVHKDPDSFKCSKCGKQLQSIDTLRAHKWSHMSKEEKAETMKAGKLIGKWKKDPNRKYPCPTCGKSYTSKSNLTEHENAVHRGKVHVCPKCGKTFAYYPSYYTHIRNICLDEDLPTLECHLCVDVDPTKKQVYKGLANLNAHIRRIHTKDALERNFVCQICSSRFKCKYILKKHVRRHEDRPRQYICKIGCGADFVEIMHWRRHNSICKGPGSRVRAKRGDRLSKLMPEEARRRWNYQAQSQPQQMKTNDGGIHNQCNVDNTS